MPSIDFRSEAEAMREELVARRRDFHMHPELAFEEVRTAGIVAEELITLGLEVQTGVGKTGVVAMLEGDRDGPTVLIRADMDALPVQEENTTDYISTVPGKMHACGHDGHTTIALGVAKLLSNHRGKMAGRVKFVFQPAEEIGRGAEAMVEDGVLRDPKPDVSLGLHLWNSLPVGILGVADGPEMAGASQFTIVIRGKGGHGALPQETVDPVVCAAHLVTALQSIVSRNVHPRDTAVLSVTAIQAGDAFNVIPPEAQMRGTVRTYKKEIFDLVARRIREVSESIGRAMGCTVEVEITDLTEPVTNDPEVAERARRAFRQVVDESTFKLDERTMGSEDVGHFMSDIPGMFFFLGSANADKGLDFGHHHPRFDFDEEALPLGVALMAAAVADYVLPE